MRLTFWLLTFPRFSNLSRLDCISIMKSWGKRAERVPQAGHVIEFSGARNIYLDKLSRKLHTTWYVTGYN